MVQLQRLPGRDVAFQQISYFGLRWLESPRQRNTIAKLFIFDRSIATLNAGEDEWR